MHTRLILAAVLAAMLVPVLQAAEVLFRDEFDGALQPGWQWIDIKGDCTKSLDARRGYLRIAITGGRHDLWTERNDFYAPRLMRELDGEGDFTLETRIEGARPDGGLLIWKDARNYARFERGIHFKNNLYFGAAMDGNFLEAGNDYVEGDRIWLRLERRGRRYAASYSVDGQQWRPMSRSLTGIQRPVAQEPED